MRHRAVDCGNEVTDRNVTESQSIVLPIRAAHRNIGTNHRVNYFVLGKSSNYGFDLAAWIIRQNMISGHLDFGNDSLRVTRLAAMYAF